MPNWWRLTIVGEADRQTGVSCGFLSIFFKSAIFFLSSKTILCTVGGLQSSKSTELGEKSGLLQGFGLTDITNITRQASRKPNFSPCRSPRVLCLTCQGCGTAKEPESISSSCYRADILDMELVLLWPHTLALLVSSRINSSQGTWSICFI